MKVPNYLYISLAVLWLYSGIVPVFFSQNQSLALLAKMGIIGHWQWVLLIGASSLDVIFAWLIMSKYRNVTWLWLAQWITVVIYSMLIAIFLPENWLHPFAPLIKNLPILAILAFLYQYHQKI